MASNDDLDKFFKKKDRKGTKPNKPTGLLTNNEELFKQLVIVTSATTAFKENLDLVDDEDDPFVHDEPVAPVVDPAVVVAAPSKSSHPPKIKAHEENADRPNNVQQPAPQQQDEWEEFEVSNPKYEELRSKYLRANRHDDDDDDDQSDNSMTHDENNQPHDERDQNKDKPVWKLDQLKNIENPAPTQPAAAEEEENLPLPPPVKTAPSTGVYRPPQMRSGAAVTVVSGPTSRPSKKKQPNIASTEEFPTLGAAVNKK